MLQNRHWTTVNKAERGAERASNQLPAGTSPACPLRTALTSTKLSFSHPKMKPQPGHASKQPPAETAAPVAQGRQKSACNIPTAQENES